MKLEDVIMWDTTANKPAATSKPVGSLFFDTDEDKMYRCNGTTWDVAESVGFTDPTVNNGDIIIRAGGVITRLAVGATDQVLTVSAGLPSWQNPAVAGESPSVTLLTRLLAI